MWKELKAFTRSQKIHLAYLAMVMVFLLFSYPLIRSSTTALFIQSFGAKNTPLVWIYSVLSLVVMVTLNNKLQTKLNLQKLFLGVSVLSLLILGGAGLLFELGVSQMPYVLYVWKEVYIVLLVHMTIGYLNASVRVEEARLFYGPFGALGSLGGIAGGVWTGQLTESLGTVQILWVGLVFVALAAFCFWKTDRSYNIPARPNQKRPLSPLSSVAEVKVYVGLLVGVIVLSQFTISLVNFKFNLVFETLVGGASEKTAYLGRLYAWINVLSLSVQLFLVPLLLSRVKLFKVHLGIPFIYLAMAALTVLSPLGWLFIVSGSFIVMKGLDYSLFAAAKELLYFPLTLEQKYGAKYLADMVFYRFAKGLISFVLLFFQTHWAVNTMLIGCLVVWMGLLVPLFQQAKKLKEII